MQSRYQNWVEGLERRLVRQPAALLRRAVSGVVSASTRAASCSTTAAAADGGAAADRSVDRRADGLHGRPARSARRLHRRSRRHGHVGDLVADAADCRQVGGRPGSVRARVPDGPAAAGARDHPHLAVLHRRARALRARLAALEDDDDLRLGPRSRPQEDVQVEGQRRHADGAARGARQRRRALLGGERTARHRHRLRSRPDEGRPASRDEAAQRLAIRAVAVRAARADHRAGRSRDDHQPGAARRRRDGAARRVPVRDRAGAGGTLVLVVLRRLPRAGEVASLRRAGPRAGGLGQQRPGREPLGAAAAVCAVPAVRDRGSVVVVARGLGAPCAPGRRRPSCSH